MINTSTHSIRSTGGAWMPLAAGSMVCMTVTAANVGSADTRVSVRLTRAAGSTIIVPDALLPGSDGQSTRLRLIPLPMIATDSIEVLSDAPVDWTLNAREVIDETQHIMLTAQTSGDTWTTIWPDAAEIHGLMCANLSLGNAAVSLRLWDGTTETLLVNTETLEEGETGRLLPVATVASGTVLQARSVGAVDFIITGRLVA